MHERTKEVDTLRRLAELLRQANTAATDGTPATAGPPKSKKEQSLRIKKLRRDDTDNR